MVIEIRIVFEIFELFFGFLIDPGLVFGFGVVIRGRSEGRGLERRVLGR